MSSAHHVTVVHGYFLGESGSEIYARELARALVNAGCDVTIVCQEPDAAGIDFVDAAWRLAPDNRSLVREFEREPSGPGSCRIVRPDIGGRVLVYAPGAAFPGFDATPMQDATDDEVEAYVSANTRALSTVLERWAPDLVQANHLVLQPAIAARALVGSDAPLVTTFHGSELTFSLSADPRLIPYAAEGIAASRSVISTSAWCNERLAEFEATSGVAVTARIVDIPPGVDTSVFVPRTDREEVLRDAIGAGSDLDADADQILVYSGALRRTKGVQHALIAFARILETHPRARFLLLGDGPDGAEMRSLADRLGRLDETGCVGHRIHFLGHQPHSRLAPILGCADVAFVPSIIPESFGLVAIEAAACGAIPLTCFHTGMRTPMGAVARHLDDPALTTIEASPGLWRQLAEQTVRVLETYPTRDPAFRASLHDFADAHFSWRECAAAYLRLA